MKRLFLLLSFTLLMVFPLVAQKQLEKIDWTKNWVVGGSGGMSYLAMELKKDLTQASMDMNSLPDFAGSLHLYKRLSKRLDLGIEYRKSFFNGRKTQTENVYWLMYSERFNHDSVHYIDKPIYYKTKIDMISLDAKLNFLNIYSKKYNYMNINFYLRGAMGLSYIGVEMGYENPSSYEGTNLEHPLYEKGQGRTPRKDSYASWSAGFGLHYQFQPRWSFFSEFSLLMVSNDYLDGVHNYAIVNQAGGIQTLQRVGVYDTIGILRFGLNYQFDLTFLEKMASSPTWRVKKKGYDNEYYLEKKNNRIKGSNLPFSK